LQTCWLLFFFCFIKTTSFWFKKKKTNPANQVTRSRLGTRVLDRADHQTGS
jgi:hypothetical protein